jgi:hypothetical protein
LSLLDVGITGIGVVDRIEKGAHQLSAQWLRYALSRGDGTV